MGFAFAISQEELKVFLDEADEQIQLLEEDVVRLEKEGETPDLIQEMFRAAHTLKGSSATLGHEKMASLTHAMETLLDKIRKGEAQVTTSIVDVLFECLDCLRILKNEIATETDSGIDLSYVMGRLGEAALNEATHQEKRSQFDALQSDRKDALARTVRVDIARLDSLMNLVGELVVGRTRLTQLGVELEVRYDRNELTEELSRTSVHIGRVTSELQEEIMKVRMLPVESVFRKFPRMVRDLAQKLQKEVEFVIEGEDTELDRSVIEEIGDPLIHLLRNAVGHGIEPPEERERLGKPRVGTVKLKAYHEENRIVLVVEDDGRGIDADLVKASAVRRGIVSDESSRRLSEEEAIDLIFASGVSTAREVDDVAGRGVGMDIVRRNLERINGSIQVETKLGKGTRFVIKLPLTLAIIQALLVTLNSQIYAIPLVSVVETVAIPFSDIQTVKGREAILLRGNLLPLVKLHELFPARRRNTRCGSRVFIVKVDTGGKQIGLVVDSLVGEQEIVIKSFGKFIGNVPGISGATILGDGRVALIVDAPTLTRITMEQKAV